MYNWRQHCGGLEAASVKRLIELEQENAPLKKMLAKRDLELDVMKEINAKMVSALARRQQVAYAKAPGLPERRACALTLRRRHGSHAENRT
ncbi:transposase A [Burkholderia lata]|nr:transposase A [Burkholderia lata]